MDGISGEKSFWCCFWQPLAVKLCRWCAWQWHGRRNGCLSHRREDSVDALVRGGGREWEELGRGGLAALGLGGDPGAVGLDALQHLGHGGLVVDGVRPHWPSDAEAPARLGAGPTAHRAHGAVVRVAVEPSQGLHVEAWAAHRLEDEAVVEASPLPLVDVTQLWFLCRSK